MNIRINNLNINYIKEGTGENFLFLHGWAAPFSLYQGVLDSVANYATVYALDLPGTGNSDEPENPWSVDDFVDFIIKFINKMELKELNIMGHSFGGRIIIKLLNRSDLPFKINKVILMDAAGIKVNSSKTSTKTKIYKVGKKILKPIPGAVEKLQNKLGSEDYKNASPIMKATMIKALNEDLTPYLENIKNETLLIWGTADTATPIEHAEIMEQKIKGSGLVRVEGGTHFCFLEQPILVYRVLESFLNTERK